MYLTSFNVCCIFPEYVSRRDLPRSFERLKTLACLKFGGTHGFKFVGRSTINTRSGSLKRHSGVRLLSRRTLPLNVMNEHLWHQTVARIQRKGHCITVITLSRLSPICQIALNPHSPSFERYSPQCQRRTL